MAYHVYLTLEMAGDYPTLEQAQSTAIRLLESVVNRSLPNEGERFVQARVFEDGKIMSGESHAFVVDICDGCI